MIIKSAYLSFPIEGNILVARIIFKDETESRLLITKRQALEVGEALLGISLDEFEWLAVKSQIHASNMINRSSDLEEIVTKIDILTEDTRRILEMNLRELFGRDDEGDEWKDDAE